MSFVTDKLQGNVTLDGDFHVNTQFVTGNVEIGETPPAFYGGAALQITKNYDGLFQVEIQNLNGGFNSSTDYVATSDNGTDSNNYIDLGINSENYNDPDYGSSRASDGYLYINGGNLALGTQTIGKRVVFHTGGTFASNVVAFVNENRWIYNSSSDDGINILQVTGNVKVHGSVQDSTGNLRGFPITNQNSDYTLRSTDNGNLVSISSGNVTVASGVFANPYGQSVTIFNNQAVSMQVIEGSGTTVYLSGTGTTGTRIIPQYSVATVICVSSNTFVISGTAVS